MKLTGKPACASGKNVGYKIFQALLVTLLVVFTTAGLIMLMTGLMYTIASTRGGMVIYSGGLSTRFFTFLMLLLIVAALFWRHFRRRE